jgi:cryptochrome
MWHRLREVYSRGQHTKPPTSLQGQLLWREFYISHGYSYPDYDRMVGNPVCRQIAWKSDPELLTAWQEAKTGYPWIDACMRQLQAQGWLHHLGRHAVACFLTRGDLYQSWEQGARHFDRLLVDADWALNNGENAATTKCRDARCNGESLHSGARALLSVRDAVQLVNPCRIAGNWMWLSASAYFYQYFRVYSPVAFPKQTDPDGDYVRKWVPELKAFPKKYIYEPWKAPLSLQRQYGCVVGTDYPERIVIHEEVSKANMALHSAAYKAAKGIGSIKIDPAASGQAPFQVGSAPAARLVAKRGRKEAESHTPKPASAAASAKSSSVGEAEPSKREKLGERQ